MSANPTTTSNPAYASVVLRGQGLAVTSSGTPSLNGTYLCESGTRWDAITAEANAILLSNGATFADGTGELGWPDKAGTVHQFTPAQFHELVVALSNFVAQCFLYGNGTLTTPPAATATIA